MKFNSIGATYLAEIAMMLIALVLAGATFKVFIAMGGAPQDAAMVAILVVLPLLLIGNWTLWGERLRLLGEMYEARRKARNDD